MALGDFRLGLNRALKRVEKYNYHLAKEVGLDPTTLSRKLNGIDDVAPLSQPEAREIILQLVTWEGISRRSEVRSLLAALDYTDFSPDAYAQPPLNLLDDDTPQPAPPATPRAATTETETSSSDALPNTDSFTPYDAQTTTEYVADFSPRPPIILSLHSAPKRRNYKLHDGFVGALCFSPDSRLLAVQLNGGFISQARTILRQIGVDDQGWGQITIIEAATGVLVRRITHAHRGEMFTLAWSPDGRWLASGGTDRVLKVWAMDDATTAPLTLLAHTDALMGIAWSPDSRHLCTTSKDRSAIIVGLDCACPDPPHSPPDCPAPTLSVQSRLVVSYREQANNAVWITDPQIIAAIARRANLDYVPPMLVAVAAFWGTISFWEPLTATLLFYFPDEHGQARVTGAGQQLPPLPITDDSPHLWRLVISPDQKQVAARLDRATFVTWDTATGVTRHRFIGHQKGTFIEGWAWTITDLAWSPDPRYIASCSDDHTVRVWDTTTGKEAIREIRLDAELLTAFRTLRGLCWSPDGRFLAVGDTLGTVEICEIAELEQAL